MPLLRVWRTLFVLLLISSLVLAARIGTDLTIDTDLADISPGNQLSNDQQQAVDLLNGSITTRIILLITGTDEGAVATAEDATRDALEDVDNLTVHVGNDAFGENLLEQIGPYRFSLLTPQQLATLQSASTAAIAQRANRELFGLSEQVRVFAFQDDPLGWHSRTLTDLFASSLTPTDTVQPVAVINVSIESGALNMQAQTELSTALDTITNDIISDFDVVIDRSGVFFFAAEAATSSKQDISLISTGSTIGVVLLLLLVFRSIRALILPIVSIALGVGFAFVLTHTLFGKVHILTIVFGASLIGIVIDYSLHYFYHGANTGDAGKYEQTALFRALALSLVTSIIGYAALSFSSLDALKKVALFSCCGLLMSWLSVVCLGQVALRKPLFTERRIFPVVVKLVCRWVRAVPPAGWIGVSLTIILCGAMIGLLGQPYSDNPRVFFSAPQHLLESERRVAAVASDFEPGRFVIIQGQSPDEVYARYAQLLAAIDRSTTLHSSQLTSLLNWVPSVESQNTMYRAQQALYGDGGAADQLYQMLGQASAAQSIKNEYAQASERRLTPDIVSGFLGDQLPPMWFRTPANSVAFALIKKGVDADELGDLSASIDGIDYVNSLQRTQSALAQQRVSASQLLILAYLLVAVLMVVRFRQWQAATLVLIPITATAMLFVLAFVLGFSLNLFHVMALFLVLGFGMDYGIFTHEMRGHAEVTLQAILLSALTSLLSFGLLGASAIPVVASFGVTLLIGNLFNLIGAFVYSHAKTLENYE